MGSGSTVCRLPVGFGGGSLRFGVHDYDLQKHSAATAKCSISDSININHIEIL